jgi:hypothetical protein
VHLLQRRDEAGVLAAERLAAVCQVAALHQLRGRTGEEGRRAEGQRVSRQEPRWGRSKEEEGGEAKGGTEGQQGSPRRTAQAIPAGRAASRSQRLAGLPAALALARWVAFSSSLPSASTLAVCALRACASAWLRRVTLSQICIMSARMLLCAMLNCVSMLRTREERRRTRGEGGRYSRQLRAPSQMRLCARARGLPPRTLRLVLFGAQGGRGGRRKRARAGAGAARTCVCACGAAG